MTVGEKIYALRTQAGYSQEEFSELIGVSRQSVSKWETSAVMPDTEYVVKICKILSISTDTLLMEGDLPTKIVEASQQEEFSVKTNATQRTEEVKEEKTERTMSIIGFVFSFIFGIVGLIISCVALREEKRPQGMMNHLAISGIAISSAKVYATVAFAVVYGILYGALV